MQKSQLGKKKTQRKSKHWYFITMIICPICGREKVHKERRYDKMPKDWNQRHKEEHYDYCDE
jgi:hypothetical protein